MGRPFEHTLGAALALLPLCIVGAACGGSLNSQTTQDPNAPYHSIATGSWCAAAVYCISGICDQSQCVEACKEPSTGDCYNEHSQ